MDYTYDGNEKVVTASVSPNVDGLTVSGKGTNVGNYAATASLSNQNYEATSITEWLRITVAPSLVTMDDVSTTYSGQAHAASAKATGVGGLETTSGIAYSYVGDGTTTYGPSEQAPKNAGSYLVTATFAGDENHSGNMATAKVTIAKALATISMQGKTVEYDGQAHKATGSANGVEDEDLTALLNVGNAFTNVPGGTANWTFAGNGNYEPASGSKGIVITPKAASVTVASLSKTYGDQDPELTGAVTGFVPADNISAAYSRLGGETVDDGPYAISAILSPSEKLGNYTITNTLGKLTILPRAVTVAAEAKSKTYGDADPALTYGIKAGNLVNGDGFVGSLTRAEGEDVKSYAIGQGSLALSSNYNLTYEGANLTITKRGIAIAAVASSKTYGDDDPALTYNITSGNLVYDDAFTGSLSREGGENVGSYSINQGSLAVSSNYHVSFTGANFEIGKRSVTITADAKSKTYGEADPALTYQLTAGSLAFMDKVTGGLSRVPNENVGDHDIQQGSVALNDNYNLTYEGATLTIGARAITITADAKSKVYGENDPELTYKITAGSLAFEDAISGSLSRATGANVGTYAIGQGTVALNANYALSYQGANLTITARPITVTADAKAKMHGQVDPTLTYQITSGNLVAGDGFTGAISREGGTEPGVYSIQQNTLTAGTNYGLTYVPASFTIHAIPTVVIANPAPTEIGKVVNVSAAFTNDIFEPKWVWGFISPTNGTVTGTTINGSTTVPTNTGVYTLTLQYKNAIGEVKTSPEAYLAVYDPAGGFVTGGGWINSPEGALVSSPGTVGKANFGFVSKYKKGTNTVEGNTEFQFTAGNVNFKSASHTAGTLVIAGSKATYKGTGFINGGTDAHDFMVVATDGQVNGGGGSDKFRIKIWKRGGEVVYDNQMSTAENAELAPTTILGGGSIVIHEVVKGTKTSSVVALADQPSAKGKFISYPNPFSDRTTFEFAFDQDEEYSLMVYSMNGALVKNITAGKALANTPVQVQWGDNSVNVGVYLVRLVTSKGTQTLRVIRK
ncbi:hypothetical protein TH61_16620 [Rufibacter sp. DG15C]|nr:hypothetical protein TH61_16620 [Rufibacter sp. DG15C]